MSEAAAKRSVNLRLNRRLVGSPFSGQPAGLVTLFFAEMWERFSYYGMRAILTYFMVAPVAAGGLGLGNADAALIYGNYTMASYMLAIPGGFISDHILGMRRSVLYGGAIIAAGHYTLAIPADGAFYLGLVLVALGTGLFKPNISAIVGTLYAPGDERRDAGFSLFYMGVNIGALLSPLVTGFLAQSETFKGWLATNGFDPARSWHWGFAAAGVGMTVALVILARRLLALAGPETDPKLNAGTAIKGGAVAAATAALMGLVMLSDRDGFEWLRSLFIVIPAAAAVWFGLSAERDRKRLGAIAVLFIAAMLFWALYEQSGSSISLFADQLTRSEAFGVPFPSSWFQSVNPLFIILLSPLFALAWTRLGSRQPSSPAKFVVGLAFLALSFLLLVPAAHLAGEGRVSPLWLVGLYLLQAIGELFLSPVGLSTMTKLASARLVGLILGVWFLSAALGNKLAGVLGSGFDAANTAALAASLFNQAMLVVVAAVLLLALTPWVKRLMGGVR